MILDGPETREQVIHFRALTHRQTHTSSPNAILCFVQKRFMGVKDFLHSFLMDLFQNFQSKTSYEIVVFYVSPYRGVHDCFYIFDFF